MKRMIRNSKCIIICAFLLLTFGCHAADNLGEEEKEVGETIVEISDESPEEESEKDRIEQEEQKELYEMVVDDEPLEKEKDEKTEEDGMETDDKYRSFLWKSWIVDEQVSGSDKFGFIITRMSGEEIEGVIVIGDDADYWYWTYGIENARCKQFKGIMKEDQAECTFEYEGYPAEVTFFFQGDNRIEAIVKCDQLDMDMCHEFCPKNFSDIDVSWNDDLSSVPVYFETWGEVNLVSATTDAHHSIPCLFIMDEEGDILYAATCLNGLAFWDIFVEDVNQDGRQDIWTITCPSVDDGPKKGSLVDIFYQTEDGRFLQKRRGEKDELKKEYFGEYQITRFCPAENYADISEIVLTQEEADQMTQRVIVIQKDLFVSYDSERRRGVRENRQLPARESMITEYRSTYPNYYWCPVSPDMSSSESYPDTYPDERLRESVGEEYYEKISGVFYTRSWGWQQFYTLEGEDKLIMHSMLTGQNFILERKDGYGTERP